MQDYFKQFFIFSFLTKMSTVKAKEIETAFFHSLGNPKGQRCMSTKDACQPQMDQHNCYSEYLIFHFEYLINPFDRHTLQW